MAAVIWDQLTAWIPFFITEKRLDFMFHQFRKQAACDRHSRIFNHENRDLIQMYALLFVLGPHDETAVFHIQLCTLCDYYGTPAHNVSRFTDLCSIRPVGD